MSLPVHWCGLLLPMVNSAMAEVLVELLRMATAARVVKSKEKASTVISSTLTAPFGPRPVEVTTRKRGW